MMRRMDSPFACAYASRSSAVASSNPHAHLNSSSSYSRLTGSCFPRYSRSRGTAVFFAGRTWGGGVTVRKQGAGSRRATPW